MQALRKGVLAIGLENLGAVSLRVDILLEGNDIAHGPELLTRFPKNLAIL
jgi:hypothetical protein